MASRYTHPRYNETFERGNAFQDLVMVELLRFGIIVQPFTSQQYQYGVGESPQGIEIKLDQRCTETDQLSIEIAEKSGPALLNYSPSGIYRPDNTWLYVQGNTECFFAFQKNLLRLLHQSGKYREHDLPTIRKFYLPLSDARKYAAFVVDRRN